MKLSLFLFFFLSIPLASADVLQGKIHSIIKGDGETPDIVRMESGRVVFLESKDVSLRSALQDHQGRFEIVTNDQNSLSAVRSVNKGFYAFDEAEEPVVQSFEPTVLKNLDKVRDVYNRMNSNYQRESQCFNRAHVWANDEYKNHGLMSEKVFVFFTASYINRNRFNWWFHVAPLVSFQNEDKVDKRVLDYRYADHPLAVKEWTDMFVYSSRPCLVTTKFSDYDVNPQTEDCYMITTNMYYWMPTDIAQRDTTNVEKETFASGSVQNAYWEAF